MTSADDTNGFRGSEIRHGALVSLKDFSFTPRFSAAVALHEDWKPF